MSTSNGDGRMTGLIPAVGYLRRSTDKQETSLEDQEAAVQRYADKNGYRILRWYTDDAVSGDDTRKRKDFLRMIEDAKGRPDFKAILCWDKARFGRFDSIEAGYHIYPLREAGIHLATVMEGVTDWNDSTDRIIGSVTQEGKHQQLVDHSGNVTRGQLGAAMNGSWLGSAPYAYRIEGDKKHKRLVIDDHAKAEVVRRIFREFVKDGRSQNNIATRLNADGIPSPKGLENGWMFDTVKGILQNPAYTGDYVGCRSYYGKYHRIDNREVRKRAGEKVRGRNPSDKWIVRSATHEAIIDRETFDRAQVLLAKGWTGRSPHPPETNPYVFSGQLRCGRCGRTMAGLSNGKYRYYECGDYKRPRTDPKDPTKLRPHCEGTTVREDEILNSLAEHLENWLGPEYSGIDTAAYYGAIAKEEDLPKAYFDLKRLLTPRPRPVADRKRAENEAKQLKAQLATARSNLVLLKDPANIPAAEACIRQLDERLAAVEQELRQQQPPAEKDVNKVVEGILWTLVCLANSCRALARPPEEGWTVVGSIESAAPHKVRWLLKQTDGIVCYTERTGAKTRIRHKFVRGELVFSPLGRVHSVGPIPRDSNPHRPG